jgi:cell shape-determining protein MreC
MYDNVITGNQSKVILIKDVQTRTAGKVVSVEKAAHMRAKITAAPGNKNSHQ